MPLKGKLVRLEGTAAVFGSQRKPEWRPIDVPGHIDRNQLIPGKFYEMEVDGNRLIRIREIAAPRLPAGGNPRAGGSARNDPLVIPRASLMASATGFAKSCLESGVTKSWMEAAHAGMEWARMWDQPQAPPVERPSPPPPVEEEPPPPQYEPIHADARGELDDEGWLT